MLFFGSDLAKVCRAIFKAIPIRASYLATMHLAIYTRTLWTARGAERVIVSIAEGLAAKGHDVDLLLEEVGGRLVERLLEGPGRIRIISLEESGGKRFLSHLLQAYTILGTGFSELFRYRSIDSVLPLLRLMKKNRLPLYSLVSYVRGERPDVALAFLNYPNMALLMAAQFCGDETRFAVNVRNHITTSAKYGKSNWMRNVPRLMRRFFPRADGILAPSLGVAEDVAEILALSLEEIYVIHNPVFRTELLALAEKDVDHPWLKGNGPPVILAAGKLRRQKDFPTLIRAFALLREQQEARLIILGSGQGREQLLESARSHGVAEDIDFPGHVENPYAYYRRASLFVLSSVWEGLPNALIEAMACGCPVVSTDCPSGPNEILEGGRYGPLVPVGDAPALAEAMGKALRDPPAREQIIARAKDFSLEDSLAGYEKALEDVAEGKKY